MDLSRGYQRWCVAILLGWVLPALAAPKQLRLTYALLRQGVAIGTVQEQLSVTGQHYQIQSVTQGLGLYRLMGSRSMLSQGDIWKNSLRPVHFESRQSKHPEKALLNDFDWTKAQLTITNKQQPTQWPLVKGTQDLLSLMYCWMWQTPNTQKLSVAVTNGKKLTTRQFLLREESTPLSTQAGQFNVATLTDQDGEKILYLAKDRGYLPVKLVVIDDGQRLEQVLTSVSP